MATEQQELAFIEGQIYSRTKDITGRFGGSAQSGIAPSAQYPAVFIFTGGEGGKFGYRDFWDTARQVYTYTGEGQVGPMTFTKGNKAIRDHVADGRAIHLFEKAQRKDGLYCYIGEMQCAATQMVIGPDKHGAERDIIQFQLVRLSALPEPNALELKSAANPDSITTLRDKAYAAVKPAAGAKKDAKRSLYERSTDVVLYALARAAGVCENCLNPAPFTRPNGKPYLEVHHIDRLSDGGLDAPHKVAALCPTCHRRAHYGVDGRLINSSLRMKIAGFEGL